MRCVWHWFGKCRNHPLKDGAKCQFGVHCTVPREDERLRREFVRMEALHGAWKPGAFKYEGAAAAPAKIADTKGDTPPPSPRK